ncbi:hypothetical protein HPB51_012275 [Rhipicephalus microplus]|uniref:Uncharacterized protein n=1 Tax=Rhipicephalus microplus TaxID=6941 RepID=A0A9J6EG29_RHIMP|nr:hypothetical protein HPB51_012275 [Rhipicephalus microplus]
MSCDEGAGKSLEPPTKAKPRHHHHSPRTGRTSSSYAVPRAVPDDVLGPIAGTVTGPEAAPGPVKERGATRLGAAPGLDPGLPGVISSLAVCQQKQEVGLYSITWADMVRGGPAETTATCVADTVPLPMEVHSTEAGDSSSEGQSTPKKRAVADEQEGVANRVRSELRDTLSALSESINKLGENFAQQQITLDAHKTTVCPSHLAHLLEAKQSLLARWKGQHLNRRLRKTSNRNKTIEEHCRVLSK